MPTELDTWFVSRPVARCPRPRAVSAVTSHVSESESLAAAGTDSPGPVFASIAIPIRYAPSVIRAASGPITTRRP